MRCAHMTCHQCDDQQVSALRTELSSERERADIASGLLAEALDVLRLAKEMDAYRDFAYEKGDEDASLIDVANHVRQKLQNFLKEG